MTSRSSLSALEIERLLDDGRPTRGVRRLIWMIAALLAVFLAWAALTPVDELARARGEVQPVGRVQTLQAEEGGRIIQLLVKEGDEVRAGQALVEFAPGTLQRDREQIAIRLGANRIERERLAALVEGRNPDFSPFEADFPLLTAEAKSLHATQRGQLADAERERRSLQQQIVEARDRQQRTEEAARRGVLTPLAASEARQQVAALQERLSSLRSASALRQQFGEEQTRLTEQFRELEAEERSLASREERRVLQAPTDGRVMGLPPAGAGAVIPPGGVVLSLVPIREEMILETMVSARDIGFVREGQPASIKIDSFDSARFGTINGTVRQVAPTSVRPREGGPPFYKVEIALASEYVGGPEHRIRAGMTGEADITTGRKSVLQFLLKPVYLAADTALHER